MYTGVLYNYANRYLKNRFCLAALKKKKQSYVESWIVLREIFFHLMHIGIYIFLMSITLIREKTKKVQP